MWSTARPSERNKYWLRCEHLLQNCRSTAECGRGDPSGSPYRSLAINGSNPIEDYVTRTVLELAGHTKGVGMPPGRERRHDECAQIRIQLIRRYNNARSCLPNLISTGWIRTCQVTITSLFRRRCLIHIGTEGFEILALTMQFREHKVKSRAFPGEGGGRPFCDRHSFHDTLSDKTLELFEIFGQRRKREPPLRAGDVRLY